MCLLEPLVTHPASSSGMAPPSSATLFLSSAVPVPPLPSVPASECFGCMYAGGSVDVTAPGGSIGGSALGLASDPAHSSTPGSALGSAPGLATGLGFGSAPISYTSMDHS